MKKKHPYWNFQEFTTFLLLYAADADFVITSEEKDFILQRANMKIFQKVWDDYKEMNDFDKIQTILTYKATHYPTLTQKNELIDLIKEEFNSDGNFTILEKNLLLTLNKLM